jgi:hypothetical protein
MYNIYIIIFGNIVLIFLFLEDRFHYYKEKKENNSNTI